MIDHPYERGPYGRCGRLITGGVACNKRKAAHSVVRLSDQGIDLRGHDGGDDYITARIDYTVAPELRPLPVVFHLRRGLGRRGEELPLDWPATWPLPKAGQIVKGAVGMVGTVRSVTFDLDRKRIVLDCD